MINEEEVLENLEKVFNETLTLQEFYKDLNKFITNNNSSKFNIIIRTLSSYHKMKLEKSNGCDFFVNLRQLINTFKKKFEINKYIADKFKNIHNIDLYLNLFQIDDNKYLINNRNISFSWLNDTKLLNSFKDIYIKRMIQSKVATGDFRLKKMTGFQSYKSPCQKFIIKALEKQQFGTSILATMKTGGGKSLLIQYISKYETKGTTIVVLPTIALTIDQYESSRKYFTEENRKVYAYYEGVSQEEKQIIFNDLVNGKVAVIYMSPESILNGMFYNKIMECAKKGILDRLVIDEAHLILDWGEFFRTEFQFLAVFRRKILKLTEGRLKTLLVSATITERSQETLKILYSEKNKFIEIRGDSLRDEISFYKIRCKHNMDRKERIKEMLPTIPKPMIIYVPIIEHAHEYYNLIKELGFENIEMFTSETSSQNREKILKDWNKDNIDIIVATAAFGMGVDKKEVRSIVHTFIPESIDRFYQEVGRSGRDGYKSYSFLFTALKEDKEHIQYFTRNKVLSAEKIIDRWTAIIKNPFEKISGHEFWISVKGVPEHLLDNTFLGKINEAWNEYVLLFLYRNDFIDILDIRIDKKNKSRLLHIKIKDLDIINNPELFYQSIANLRALDREYINKDISAILKMIEDESMCWGKIFEKIYEYTELKCSGCSICRKNGQDNRTSEDYFEVIEGNTILTDAFNFNIEKNKKIIIDLENNICKKTDYIIDVCNNENIESLVLPNKDFCNKIIENKIHSKMYLYTYDEAFNIEENLLRGKVAIVLLKGNDTINDKLYKKYNAQYNKNKVKNLVYLSDEDVYIKSEYREIERCIENVSYIRR